MNDGVSSCVLRIRGAEKAFLAGKAFLDAKVNRDQAIFWRDFVKDNLPVSVATVNKCIRLYEAFKDCPEALVGKTAAQALKEMRKGGVQ